MQIVRESGTDILAIDCESKDQAKVNKMHFDAVLKIFSNIKGIYLIDKEKKTLKRINDHTKVKFVNSPGIS